MTVAHARALTVAVIGNPNTGKSTLFSALTGVHSRIGNYPGVTVEKKLGSLTIDGRPITLVDLPGTYSLSPRSPDEMVSVDVLLGRQPDVGRIDAVICIIDASNLERNFYLFNQLLEIGLPIVLVLNMFDLATGKGVKIELDELRRRLNIPVVACEAHREKGMQELREAILQAVAQGPPAKPNLFPAAFLQEVEQLKQFFPTNIPPDYLLERLLLDVNGHIERYFVADRGEPLQAALTSARQRLAATGCKIPAVEAKLRYQWAREVLTGVANRPVRQTDNFTDKLDRWLTHRWVGLLVFSLLMFVIFQTLYQVAAPLMDLLKAGQAYLADGVKQVLPAGPLQSLLTDGVIAGVGGVLVFLPQICLLFLFIALLEDCGYMARAAFLMDKLMTKVGLSGKSFVPLMSSFACAIPGVMATRVIENRRDRMVTILVAPLMSCSARLPVYLLLINAFVPAVSYANGWITLQGLLLFASISLGAVVAIPVAWILKKTLFQGETPPFVMELPSYKWPSPRIVLFRVYDRAKAFVLRAGTLIFATSVLIWALGYFPGEHEFAHELQRTLLQFESENDPRVEAIRRDLNREQGRLLERSYLGRMGHAIEPVVKPLGWDWRIGVGVVASFPAREVIISTLGTIYSLGGDVDAENAGLQDALHTAKWPDGRDVYNLPVALSIIVFFALCAQCASTLMVIQRETNSWRWPLFTFTYMTTLAYVGAWLTFQIAARICG